MEIKLIACDLDGTLLDSERRVSARTKEAVDRVLAAGKQFIIATGRMYIAARPYAEQLGLDVPIVTYNGALIRGSRSGKIYLEQPLKIETAQEVLDFAREQGLYAQFYVGDTMYIEKQNSYSKSYADKQGIHAHVVALGEAFYTAVGQPYKILLMMEPEQLQGNMALLKEKFKHKLHVTSSHPMFLELLEPGVNKWQAINELAAQFSVKPSEIMCLGDSDNDYEMISNAALGVAMANASEHVKKGAQIITASNNEDGVALALEQLYTSGY